MVENSSLTASVSLDTRVTSLPTGVVLKKESDRLLKEQFYKSLVFSLSLFAVVKGKSRIFSALSLSFMDTMQSNYSLIAI